MELLCVIAERKTTVYHVLHLRLFKNEKSMALKGDCGLTCTKDALIRGYLLERRTIVPDEGSDMREEGKSPRNKSVKWK